jgi:hypothetical protein
MIQNTLFPECPHSRTTVLQSTAGPHHGKKICSDCGKFLGWIPKPETLERQKQNLDTLSALSKKTLTSWEREFVRSLSTKGKLSPRQQETLTHLKELYLK